MRQGCKFYSCKCLSLAQEQKHSAHHRTGNCPLVKKNLEESKKEGGWVGKNRKN